MSDVNLKEVLGRTLSKIVKIEDRELHFYFDDGDVYYMLHHQDCCESVYLEDIVGNLEDLLNSPLLVARERTNTDSVNHGVDTWTFYELSTIKGSVVLRWYGTSNGYYSTNVSFGKTKDLWY